MVCQVDGWGKAYLTLDIGEVFFWLMFKSTFCLNISSQIYPICIFSSFIKVIHSYFPFYFALQYVQSIFQVSVSKRRIL